MAISVSKGGNFEKCPEGEYNAVLCDVVDLGMLPNKFDKDKREQHKVLFCWQVDKLDERGLPFLIFKRYTASLHEKAVLYKDLSRWFRGSDVTAIMKAAGRDLESLIGKGCRLDLVHNEDYVNVDSIKPLPKGQEAPKIHPDFIRKKDRKDGDRPYGKRSEGEASDPEEVNDDDIPF